MMAPVYACSAFRNCITNCHRYCTKTELLANVLASTCKRHLWWITMESIQSILSLQDSTSKSELLELLCTLTVPKLKLLCKENVTITDMISFKYCVLMKKFLGNWLLQLQVLQTLGRWSIAFSWQICRMIIDTELIYVRKCIRIQGIRESYLNLGRPLAQGVTILGTQD